MRFDAAVIHLLLSAAAIGAAASAESPARKRSLRAPAGAQAVEGDAPVAVAATAVEGDARAAIMTPQEEEDIRLLALNDAVYWKNFLDGDEGSLGPKPDGCNFDVNIDCAVKFAGGSRFRDCDDAFVCASDITEQRFEYLGGSCNDDPTGARNYECKTYKEPGINEKVRILVVYGDFWDTITRNDAATYQMAKKELNDKTDDKFGLITIVDIDDVEPWDTYSLKDLGDRLGTPDDVDTNDLTYVVFEDGNDGALLLKATWQWKCNGSNAGRYAIFDNFGSSSLIAFKSKEYGYAEVRGSDPPGNPEAPPAQVKLTTTLKNQCDADGMVAHLDRRFCYRDVGDSSYKCTETGFGPPLGQDPKLCVDEGQFATGAQCDANGPLKDEGTMNVPFVIPKGGDITFEDEMYTQIVVLQGREYQYRVPNATVYFKNDDRDFISNLNTQEEWFFGEYDPNIPAPAPVDCDFEYSNIECEVSFNDGSDFRVCDDAWKCTNDMENQKFRYLGGGCQSGDQIGSGGGGGAGGGGASGGGASGGMPPMSGPMPPMSGPMPPMSGPMPPMSGPMPSGGPNDGSGGNTSGRNNGEVQYVCNTFGGGPDDFNRYVQIYQGDWFGLINQGDTIATVQGKIGSNNGMGCDASDVRILNQNNVRPGDILTPDPFKQSPLCNLKPGDEEFLTYVVYQRTTTDRNQTQAQVRMKSSWKWDCAPSPDNPFFPMQAEYSVWNNFANAELLAFQSTKFGTVEQGLAEARFNYTIDNLCNVEGEVRKLDRQLCARTCDDSQDEDWNCPAVGVSGSPKPLVQCVAGGIAVETCSTTTPRVTLPPNGSRKITDNYGDIPVYPDYEFQVRLLGTKVKFGTDDMMKSKAEVKEVFEFCALETGGSGGGGISGDGPNPPSPGPNPGGPGQAKCQEFGVPSPPAMGCPIDCTCPNQGWCEDGKDGNPKGCDKWDKDALGKDKLGYCPGPGQKCQKARRMRVKTGSGGRRAKRGGARPNEWDFLSG